MYALLVCRKYMVRKPWAGSFLALAVIALLVISWRSITVQTAQYPVSQTSLVPYRTIENIHSSCQLEVQGAGPGQCFGQCSGEGHSAETAGWVGDVGWAKMTCTDHGGGSAAVVDDGIVQPLLLEVIRYVPTASF